MRALAAFIIGPSLRCCCFGGNRKLAAYFSWNNEDGESSVGAVEVDNRMTQHDNGG